MGETKMKTRRQTRPTQRETDRQTDSQREGVERRVERRTPNVIQHSSHGVQGRKERDRKESKKREGGIKGEEGEKGEEGGPRGEDKTESLTRRQTAFQCLAAALQVLTPCGQHRSTFGDFPSSQIRLDIYPPPLLPGSSAKADSQIKIARGTIQTLLPFCWECLLWT